MIKPAMKTNFLMPLAPFDLCSAIEDTDMASENDSQALNCSEIKFIQKMQKSKYHLKSAT